MLHLPNLKFPSKLHCQKVASHLPPATLCGSILLAKGQVSLNRDNTDTELQFHQESNFFYLTGIDEPDYYFVYHFATSTSYLIAPDIDLRHTVWKGPVLSDDELLRRFDVDHVVRYSNLLHLLKNTLKPRHIYGWNEPENGPALEDKVLEHELRHYIIHRLIRPKHCQHLIRPKCCQHRDIDDENNGNGGKEEEEEEGDADSLYEAFVLARIHKSPIELALSREATRISSDAHRLVMQRARVGMYEYQLEHLFRYECGRRGGRTQGYLPIVGRGVNAAYLHYTRNNERIQHGDLVLIDAACEFEGYTSDITRTFPVSGRFSTEQAEIYQLVAEMQNSVLRTMKAGVDWKEMAQLSREIGLQGLKKLGIVVGADEDLRCKNIIALFYPHGLGHLLGLNVHDDGLGLSASEPPIDRDQRRPREKKRPERAHNSRVLFMNSATAAATTATTTTTNESSAVEIHAHRAHAAYPTAHPSLQDEGAAFLQELLTEHPLPPPSTRRHQRAAGSPSSSSSSSSAPHAATTFYATPGTLLQPGMLLTVEPGIYFSPLVLSIALQDPTISQHLDADVLRRYMSVGGVRIEDVVYIRPNDGLVENITSAPKALAEVEAVVQEAIRERAKDECRPSLASSLEGGKDDAAVKKLAPPSMNEKEDLQQQQEQEQNCRRQSSLPKTKRVGLLKRMWRALKSLV
ncbi:hypothetical protein DFQ27_003615 [Actinomortierella ambigua]|uniref:Aminopeptidase P N-terminal domain-containing protein n=1 Tax=Actinomortierella ambigua TaxID=1343610 RepID=A0A9P6U5M3_9FUNG|nr:hypothetical protein DFQ27_003615 [Actinomortierella ambigua]